MRNVFTRAVWLAPERKKPFSIDLHDGVLLSVVFRPFGAHVNISVFTGRNTKDSAFVKVITVVPAM